MFWESNTRKYLHAFFMVNVIVRARETKELVGFVLRQQSNCWSNPAQLAHFFPRLTERILRAVLVVSRLEGIEECLVHHSWGQHTCLLTGACEVSSKKTLKLILILGLLSPTPLTWDSAALLLLLLPPLFCMKVRRAKRKERKAKAE